MTDLTNEAVDALRKGSVIEAIKITRHATGLGLKEAKDIVDAYLQQHPELKAQMPQISQETTFRVVIVIIGVALLLWFVLK